MKKIVLGLFCIAFIAGCATMRRGSTESMMFVTAPSGAMVKLSTGESCITPCELEVDRSDDLNFTISKSGYKKLSQTVYSSLDGGSLASNTIGNLILLPGVADIIDARYGANYSHKPNPFVSTLLLQGSEGSYDIPTGFIAANRVWWDRDQEKTRWIKQQHQILLSDGITPNDDLSSPYWSRMLAAVAEFDLIRAEREEKAEKNRDTSIVEALLFGRTQASPNDFAVIIGNSEYQHPDIVDVKPAHKDLEAFKKYASQGLGIPYENIIEVKDASGAQMLSLFGSETDHKGSLYNRLYAQPQPGRLYVYYSGHGVPSLDTKEGYLVPVDADPEVFNLASYPLRRLYANVSQLPATERNVIIEACFSGSSSAGPLINKASPVVISLEENEVPLNIYAATATSAGEVASWDDGNGNSIFTKHYLLGASGKADANGDNRVTRQELSTYVSAKVRSDARKLHGRSQNPVFR